MFWRIIRYSFFFLCIVALVLYFAGVREIDLFHARSFFYDVVHHFDSMKSIRIPNIPEWIVDLGSNPSFWEKVEYYLTFVVNFFVGLYNVIIGVFNMVGDLFKVVVAFVWVLKDSPEGLIRT